MIVEISVVPNSKRFAIRVMEGKVKIHLTNPPEDNRANFELIKELSKKLSCQVRLIGGQTSKRKRLEIGISEAGWAEFLGKQEK